jgi:hypothetical protein
LIYLAWYLVVGGIVLAIMLISNRMDTKRDSLWVRQVRDELNPERKTLRYRILGNVVAPALAALLVLAVWPVALGMVLKDRLTARAASAASAASASKQESVSAGGRGDLFGREHVFAVAHSDLRERLTIEDIEGRERVIDPLAAVPDLPFGHLNTIWKSFVDDAPADSELWSFCAHWQGDWGVEQRIEGYVAVRNQHIGPHLVVIQCAIESS